MDWYIKKVWCFIKSSVFDALNHLQGESVNEHKPFQYPYYTSKLVSEGPPSRLHCTVYVCVDPKNEGAPTYKDSSKPTRTPLPSKYLHLAAVSVKPLVKLETDLSMIPESAIDRQLGKDGKEYYRCNWAIEMTNYSASTKYEMVYKGVRYSAVTAEYV